VNPALITVLGGPSGIAVSDRHLFVAVSDVTSESSRIGKYTTSGATVNRSLIPNLGPVGDIVVSGDKLFVANVGFWR
jgi:hypothetical protein